MTMEHLNPGEQEKAVVKKDAELFPFDMERPTENTDSHNAAEVLEKPELNEGLQQEIAPTLAVNEIANSEDEQKLDEIRQSLGLAVNKSTVIETGVAVESQESKEVKRFWTGTEDLDQKISSVANVAKADSVFGREFTVKLVTARNELDKVLRSGDRTTIDPVMEPIQKVHEAFSHFCDEPTKGAEKGTLEALKTMVGRLGAAKRVFENMKADAASSSAPEVRASHQILARLAESFGRANTQSIIMIEKMERYLRIRR